MTKRTEQNQSEKSEREFGQSKNRQNSTKTNKPYLN